MSTVGMFTIVREGGLEDESIVNKDLQMHLERYLHPGSPHLSHSAPWKDFGLLQPAYQIHTVIDQPLRITEPVKRDVSGYATYCFNFSFEPVVCTVPTISEYS